jgi:hypothetical protein
MNTMWKSVIRQLFAGGKSISPKKASTERRSRRKKRYLFPSILAVFSRSPGRGSDHGLFPRPRRRSPARGFVLPTVTMVLLVFSLVVSSILLRTSQQTQQVAGARTTQTLYNVSTPALDRAKSKLEFLFKRDPRFKGVPGERDLERFLLNRQNPPNVVGDPWPDPYTENGSYVDIYTLPGETRIDLNGDNVVDNAWAYNTDMDGNGTSETVAYSILVRNQNGSVTLDSTDATKAANLITRTGPLTIQSGSSSSTCGIPGGRPQGGWYPINTATDRKNLQVNAVVVNRDGANRTVSSIEFQQDRQIDKGNKWGVWFRYDLEAFPGPEFNWNGAMHTDGNILWGDTSGGVGISAHLISSPNSCLYTADASEITMSQVEDRSGRILFQGQAINANPARNQFNGTSEVDIHPGSGIAPSSSTNPASRAITLSMNTDSVKDNLQTNSPYDFSLDPVVLFTEDRSESRYSSDVTNRTVRDSGWSNGSLSRRIINKLVRRPYVDDLYRADDRWGPKPRYNDQLQVPDGASYGQLITENTDVLIKENPLIATPDDVGLDGYWERRARVQGLRLIVGQRLELGNTFGWMGNNDPLYPPNSSSLANIARQRKSLRDNLAAVQSTLIYHYENANGSGMGGDFPVATLATTVHPGTTVTRDNATRFTKFSDNNQVNTDFLNGVGTNGWEFNPPGNASDEEAFIALIDNASDPLRIALTNLSRMAGDPDGAFPPKQEASGGRMHPYPRLTMWGDFSSLRRALGQLEAGTSYADLSLADRTTIQTAASTIGLLAYNLDNAKRVYDAGMRNGPGGITALGEHLWKLVDGNTSNGEVNLLLTTPVPFPSGYQRNRDAASFYGQFSPEQYIEAIRNDNSLGNADRKDELIERARQLVNLRQIERDRALGFVSSRYLPAVTGSTSGWNATTGNIGVGNGNNATVLRTSCDPDVFNDAIGTANGLLEKKVGLAMAFCPANMPPKYPTLYYLFPKSNHDQIGNNFNGAGVSVIDALDDQPTTEEYISDRQIFDATVTVTNDINHGFIYRVVGDTDSNGRENGTENGIATLALQPRTRVASGTTSPGNSTTGTSTSSWRLPHTTTNTGTGNVINDSGTNVYLAFLDKALYNGRQLLQERILDVDLNLIRSQRFTSASDADTWMTESGIIYAFREDALREDGIARPRPLGKTFEDCETEADLVVATSATVPLSSTCMMNASSGSPQDPPASERTGVSPKPIDFYADPDRRSHGFRLKNGADVSRVGTEVGFSFISDSPVYIQGDLNLHQNSTGSRFEEFTVPLASNWSNFYTRGGGGSNGILNADFAKPDRDRWRPVEILGDSLTLLSNNFCDGTVEDGFRNTNSDCPTGGNSSYRNSTLANGSNTSWQREANPTLTTDSLNSPIRIDRNAQASRNNTVFNDYRALDAAKTLGTASETRMNAIFINGLVPSRAGQSYGGLHNFPRFIEDWNGDDLHIAGAFVQLNFSTYATAPFDQEAWNPGEMPSLTSESIDYYSPPNRRWGYDVALQYSRPGPVANRFVSVGTPRNEYYRQIPADDPYSRQLRCSRISTNGPRVDANAADCS